jgi:hypothetical protein
MKRTIAIIVLAASVTASTASAALHYFTQGATLYSTADNGVTTQNVGITFGGNPVTISSLAFDPSGNLWGGTTQGGNLYRINPATGVATATAVPPLGGQTNTFDFRQNGSVLELLAFTTFSGGRTDFQVYNANTGAVINAATLALDNTNPGIPASAYLGGNSIFAFDGVSYNLRSYTIGAIVNGGSIIGNTGISWSQAGGAEFNGQLWLGTRIGSYNPANGQQNHGTSGFRFGTVDTGTGAFTQVFTVSEKPFGGGFGYAIFVPEPSSALILVLGGLVASRRRRA